MEVFGFDLKREWLSIFQRRDGFTSLMVRQSDLIKGDPALGSTRTLHDVPHPGTRGKATEGQFMNVTALATCAVFATFLAASFVGSPVKAQAAAPSPTAPATTQKAPATKAVPGDGRSGMTRPMESPVASNGKGRNIIDAVKQCEEAWDKGTHVDRKRWAALCRSNLAEKTKDAAEKTKEAHK
jgi:hypothetical protein